MNKKIRQELDLPKFANTIAEHVGRIKYAHSTIEARVYFTREYVGTIGTTETSVTTARRQGNVRISQVILIAEAVIGAKLSVRFGTQRNGSVSFNAIRSRIHKSVVAFFIARYLITRIVTSLAAILLNTSHSTRRREVVVATFHRYFKRQAFQNKQQQN